MTVTTTAVNDNHITSVSNKILPSLVSTFCTTSKSKLLCQFPSKKMKNKSKTRITSRKSSKSKKSKKGVYSTITNFVLCRVFSSVRDNINGEFQKIKDYLSELPMVIALLKVRDKVSEKLLCLILAFFAFVAPFWNFFFIKTPKPKKTKIGIS